MRKLFIGGLLGLGLLPVLALAQDCSSTCDASTGVSRWYGTDPVYDYDFRCTGAPVTTTLCGGYASSYYVVYGGPSNTSVGWPHAIQADNGTVYMVFGYHHWGSSDNLDRIYLGTSTDGGQTFSVRQIIDNSQFCIYGSSGCEFWSPDLVIRDDGTWLLYVSGHQTASHAVDQYVARSTDGGSTFSFDWVGDNHNGNGVMYDTQAYRLGVITSKPGGPFIFYAIGNSGNEMWEFTSSDGITWTRGANLGLWGIGINGARYDNVGGYFIATIGSLPISDDCNTPSWVYPLVQISFDGATYSTLSVENYF